MGLFKSLFGKSEEDPFSGLSADAIRQKIADHNHEIEQLKHKLPSASSKEGMAKSAARKVAGKIVKQAAKGSAAAANARTGKPVARGR